MTACRKQVIYDLDTNLLIEATGRRDARLGYSQIHLVLDRLGYDKPEYSGYVTREPREDWEVQLDFELLNQELLWFFDCCRDCRLSTVIEDSFDLRASHYGSVPPQRTRHARHAR